MFPPNLAATYREGNARTLTFARSKTWDSLKRHSMPVMPYKKQAVSALLSLLQGKIDTPTEITRARATKKLGIGGQEDRGG